MEREVAERPGDRALTALLEEVLAYPGVDHLPARAELPSGSDLLLPLHVRTPVGDMRLLTTIATIGAPFDVTLEELRLETLLPADGETEAVLRSLASHADAGGQQAARVGRRSSRMTVVVVRSCPFGAGRSGPGVSYKARSRSPIR